MDLTLPSKDKDCEKESKSKIQQSIVYKKHTSQADTCRNGKQAGIAIFISDKAYFTQKSIRRDKGHYILIKVTIQKEDITILNKYAPKIRAPTFIKQTL
jgi:hypothetical protein